MRLSSFAGSDVGRTRSGNEDSYFCGRTVFAVADGLGGHQGGEVASAAAVAPLAALDGREFADPDQAAEALAVAIREANSAILDRAAGDPGLWGMGTTMTAAAVAGDSHLQLAHVGDSRAYLLRDGDLEQLTTDHTVVGELVRRGRLTPEQAAIHPERSILTRAVGLDPRVLVDTPDPVGLRPGDQVLLCSDGLTEAVADARIAELLSAGADGETACRSLIDAANTAGGPDNITVVLIRVDE
ncbi:MAG TPA: Stp1/IreP family PP2C-type Ser/Thr phosphatase [Actinomycetota bacterium]|jgi:protein phosphatase|nr:Stp1/IreP family PP2C-type Ser/Thr phosphatase [Actinomycetota bacterium]